MPRLLAAEYVYSGAMDDCYNEYVTAATPTPSLPPTIQQPQPIATPQIVVPSQQICVVTNMPANTLSNVQVTTTSQNLNAAGTQQIHTISSSDDDDEEIVLEQNTIEEEITNISSDECGDFEGFDDFTTPNSSGLINDASQEDLNVSSNYLKRHSYIDFNDYREDSEGVVEAIEVEDDEEIAVGEDGEIFYRTIDETTPKKSQAYRCEPHTPNKRKKQENDNYFNAISPAQLKTPPDQIVEVNSDSTTNSLKQKRQQINTKFQLNLSQQQPQKIQQNLNKCSTESTSEFPVSSPSNPQQPRGGKYPPRPPLLKNTLPADSFERQLAMITACNPQMSLEEKIQTWQCDEELSDVEDVNRFDEEFKRVEKQKKLEMKQREKSVRVKNTESKNYDFFTFRQMLLSNMNEQRNTKLKTNNQTVGGFVGVSGNKCIESSGSESSKSVVQVDERPSTSAVAQQQLQQRRCKPTQINLETGEPKKRLVKEQSKRNQNSTTPPQTSSSDNERECFQNTKIALNNQNKLNSRQIGQEKVKLLQPSSSEEAISQEIPKHRLMKFNNKVSPTTLKNIQIATTTNHLLAGKGETLNNTNSLTKNPRILTDEEIDSVFRLHRLNRERDKFNSSPPNVGENLQPTSIIQMRFDFADEHKSELLMEKKQELFKTPIIPQKYLANTPHIDIKDRISPTLSAGNSLKNTQDIKHEISSEKSLKTNNSNHNNDEVLDVNGIYHQQHEFCNYLGLTGMSTATAMANAVAELAQCNLARRSMRVLRQQQQEKRDKSAKEEKQLEALKMKQLKEIRKRERGGSDNYTTDMLEEDIMIKSEGSHSQTSEALTPNKEPKKKTSNSNTKSSTKSQNSITIIKKEPEIKILCHIAAKNKEKAEQLAKDCIKDITQPIKETLIKQAKLQATDKTLEEFKNKIKKEDKTDGKNETEQFNRSLRSPRLTRSKTPIIATKTTTRTKTQKQNEFKNEQQVNGTFKEQCKLESSTSLIEKNDKSPCLKRDNVMLKQNSFDDDINLRNPDIHLISSSSSNIIQQKLQMALEESRKTKPSIFIVQSLESKKEQTLNNNTLDEVTFETEDNLQAVTKTVEKSFQNGKQFYKKRNLKKSYKTNKNKKYPTCKRKLRNRKIIVIKTLKPKQKSLETLKEIKRELRSSPRHHQQEKQEKSNNKFLNSETKSYRTVHTETKDLELYLKHHNTQTKTRLMAKASALLERSRRMSLRINNTGVNSLPNNTNIKSKLTSSHIQRSSKLNLHGTRTQILKSSRLNNSEKFNTTSISQHQQPTSSNLMLDNDNVVVSSTTNNYDERPVLDSLATTQSPTITLRSLHNTASYVIASSPIQTKDQYTQCSIHRRVQYFNSPPLATQFMRNPLKSDYGKVLYIYLELDILIVIQESLISFWKCSKLINILSLMPNSTTTTKMECSHQMAMKQQEQGETLTTTTSSSCVKQSIGGNCCNTQMRQPASSSSSNFIETSNCGEWLHLGELRRLNYDFEISVPYANRMCLHNSTPIYLEMRAKQLPKNQRDCNLLSMYINIYYYHDEDMIAKCNSIALDTIQSDINSVNYTTLVDSRYFIMTWPQENLLGKTRSGLCKYSLTPQLDTLASIREFKSMRHTIRYLECMSDDKLIGFGDTQITIWDHRSGDVLMNFDLEIPLGKNLGSIYFSSHDIEQNNMLILHQYRDSATSITSTPQLMTLACTVTHNQPSYRLLQEINLPQSAFKNIQCAINNGDHLVITGENNEELWISTTNPALINIIQTTKNSKRFYSREKTHLIELTEQTLSVNTIANHLMQLAAAKLSLN